MNVSVLFLSVLQRCVMRCRDVSVLSSSNGVLYCTAGWLPRHYFNNLQQRMQK
jgi:hypothetical protein